MENLIIAIVTGLVDNKDSITVTADEPDEEGTITYHLHVAQEDMGRVIGKQGRIAKEIRSVMRSVANRDGEKILVEIDD